MTRFDDMAKIVTRLKVVVTKRSTWTCVTDLDNMGAWLWL